MASPAPKTTDRDAVAALLKVQGCPYPPGSVDSVVWLQGYQAGVAMALQLVEGANLYFGQPLQ